jgi:hypothetical protein
MVTRTHPLNARPHDWCGCAASDGSEQIAVLHGRVAPGSDGGNTGQFTDFLGVTVEVCNDRDLLRRTEWSRQRIRCGDTLPKVPHQGAAVAE